MTEILHAIQPILRFCKFFGFFPLNILNIDDKKSTAIYLVVITFWTLVWNYISYDRITMQYGHAMHGSSLSKIVFNLSVILMLSMMLIIGVGNFLKRDRYKELVRTMEKVDQKLLKFGISINYKTRRNCAKMSVAIIFIMLISFFTITSKLTYQMKIHQDSSFYLKGSSSTIMYVAILVNFAILCVIMSGISSRLNILNRNLKENLKNEFKSDQFWTSFASIFSNLRKAIDILNGIFSVPFAIFISTNLLLVSFLVYDYYALFAIPNNQFMQLYFCLFSTLLKAYMFSMIFVTIYCCTSVKSQATETKRILLKYLINTTRKGQNLKIWNLIHHVELTGLNLSCGMFEFDWKILFTYFCQVFTYATILIQFDASMIERN